MKKMKNKKGFTLIELLAVIVVLAIVLIIAVPRVLRVIEDSEKESFRITGENLLKGVKDKALIDSMTGVPSKTYTIEDGAFVDESISISGKMPNEGTIEVFSDGKIGLMIKDDKYCAIKEVTDTKVRLEPLEECVLNIPEEVPQSCFTYTKTSSAVTITGYDNACSKNLIIPNTIDGLPVTTIATNAFNRKGLKSLEFPNTLTTIGGYAFGENYLKSLNIPKNVKNIGNRSFNGNLLPDDQAFIYKRNSDGSEDKTTIVSYAGREKDKIIVPNEIKTISVHAFWNTKMKDIVIPTSVTTIGIEAFAGGNLLPDEKAFIYARNGDGSEDTTTIVGYGGARVNNVQIPNGVTTIKSRSFSYCHLRSVALPNSVTIIEDMAFMCNRILQGSFTIDNSEGNVTIGSEVFKNNGASSNQYITPVYLR